MYRNVDTLGSVAQTQAQVLRDGLIERVPFHYGWVILVSGAIGAFMTLPGQTQGVSVFFDPIAVSLNLSRPQMALAYTIGTLVGTLPAPLVGRWIDRRGPRLTAGIIALSMAVACAVMASSSSALTLTIGFAALRGSAVGALSLVSQHVINLWFVHRRGIAAAAASLGLAVGSMCFPPFMEALINAFGWRRAYLLLGALVGGTMVPVGLLLFRARPELFGLRPDLGRQVQKGSSRPEPSFTRAQAIRTPLFYTLALANLLSNAIGTGLLLNHFDLMTRIGLAREAAVLVFGPLAITQVCSVIAMGPVVDRLRPHMLLAVPMASMACACVLGGMGGAPLGYAILLGLALGSFQSVNIAVYAHYYGRTNLGEIRGLTFVITIVGAALGPVLFSWGSAHGSYVPVLGSAAAMCLLAALANLLVRPPRPPVGAE
jgi:MFS family permease